MFIRLPSTLDPHHEPAVSVLSDCDDLGTLTIEPLPKPRRWAAGSVVLLDGTAPAKAAGVQVVGVPIVLTWTAPAGAPPPDRDAAQRQ